MSVYGELGLDLVRVIAEAVSLREEDGHVEADEAFRREKVLLGRRLVRGRPQRVDVLQRIEAKLLKGQSM